METCETFKIIPKAEIDAEYLDYITDVKDVQDAVNDLALKMYEQGFEDAKDSLPTRLYVDGFNDGFTKGQESAVEYLVKNGYIKYGFETEYLLEQIRKGENNENSRSKT